MVLLCLAMPLQEVLSQAVTIRKRDAVVWSQAQRIAGTIDTSIALQGILVTNESFPRTVAQMSEFEFPVGGFSTRMFVLADSVVITSAALVADNRQPLRFELAQNYPNPFNPITTITFTLPRTGAVTLTVYDVLGREVREILDEVRSEGSHTVSFDASSLASGMYFYRLQYGEQSMVKRMILLK